MNSEQSQAPPLILTRLTQIISILDEPRHKKDIFLNVCCKNGIIIKNQIISTHMKQLNDNDLNKYTCYV